MKNAASDEECGKNQKAFDKYKCDKRKRDRRKYDKTKCDKAR